MATLNPRFVAYAAAHGRTPEQMLEFDSERYPGGLMVGFMSWIRSQWAAWGKAIGHPCWSDCYAIKSPEDHSNFTSWLQSTCCQPPAATDSTRNAPAVVLPQGAPL